MKKWGLIISVSLIIICLILSSSCCYKPTPAPTITTTPETVRSIKVNPVRTDIYTPSHVNFIFSLRDQDDHAIIVSPEQLKVRIFEDNKEIDPAETIFFVDQAESFDMEVVLVLDFSNSMKTWGGIPLMIDGAKAAIHKLAEAHRIGLVEYHDRNSEPGILQPLIADKTALDNALNDFMNKGFLSGASLCWDAVYKGLSLYTLPKVEKEEGKHIVRALVFLSDGRDTSSTHTRSEIIDLAKAVKTQIYVLGLGQVFEEKNLQDIAKATGGAYYKAEEARLLGTKLEAIATDLRGQYIVRYVTLQTTGKHKVKYNVSYLGFSVDVDAGTLDLGSVFTKGADLVGQVNVDHAVVASGHLETFVRAMHIPREINSLKFRIGADKPVTISLPQYSEGGLLDGWQVKGPDSAGYFLLSSPSPEAFLNFGDSGLLFKIAIEGVGEGFAELPLEFDNSIYKFSQGFVVAKGT